MASLYTRKNSSFIWIKYTIPNETKPVRKSTGLLNNKEGWRKATELLKEVNAETYLEKKRPRSQQNTFANKTIEDSYKHFKIQLSTKSKTTQDEYKRFYERFITFFPKDLDCNKITKTEIEKFLVTVNDLPKLQRNSKHVIYKNTKRFLNFLFDYNYIPFFKLSKDFRIKPEVKEILIFDLEDLKKIFIGLKDMNTNFQTMLYLLIYTGLRPSDIINIRKENIDFATNTLTYYSPKTDQHRKVPLHLELIPILKARLDEIKIGKLIQYASAKNMGHAFSKFADKLELNTNYNLRTFRKTFISLAHSSGMDLATVSKLVGHSNISTTSKYYHKLDLLRQNSELNKIKLAQLGTQSRHTKKPRNKKAS